jgi:hypothetical protein
MDIKKPFWAWVFSESDGTPSLSRVATAILVAFAMGWVTNIVWKTHALPDFAGLALFVGTLYGLNKSADFLTAWKGNNSQPKQ